jgi:hypothetical protein
MLLRCIALATILSAAIVASKTIPLPTPPQLFFQNMEIGALVTYNMATAVGTQGCPPNVAPPPASIFNEGLLPKANTDQWCDAVASFGGKYATLVAKHMCGFALWPTEAKSGNFTYNYGVEGGRDIVREFAESCSARGVKLGIYYSVNANAYLNVQNGKVGAGAWGTRPIITQSQYADIVQQQLTELWTRYGSL